MQLHFVIVLVTLSAKKMGGGVHGGWGLQTAHLDEHDFPHFLKIKVYQSLIIFHKG